MDTKPIHGEPLALEPLEVVQAGEDTTRTVASGASPDAKARRDLRLTTQDEFLAAAAKEYEAGRIDRALWRLAADQSAEASLVIAAYLRARAAALQSQDGRSPRQAVSTGPMLGASDRRPKSEPHWQGVLTKLAGARSVGAKNSVYVGAGALAIGFVVATALLIVSPRKSEPVQEPIASAAAPSSARPAPQNPLTSEQPPAKGASDAANQGSPDRTLEAKVQQLKDDGNWNVLVPYAAEWTRKEPNNAAAWNDLSVGYVKLRQFNDARDAATKAVELAPENPLFWRNLGQINLAVNRLPEARIAFDRALALNSDDTDALCGAAVAAQRQGQPTEAAAIAERAAAIGAICPRVNDGASVAAVVGGSAARK